MLSSPCASGSVAGVSAFLPVTFLRGRDGRREVATLFFFYYFHSSIMDWALCPHQPLSPFV